MIATLARFLGVALLTKVIFDVFADDDGDEKMYDCHKDMLAFHNDRVALPEEERTAMRKRRDANRRRLKDGLKRDDEPAPVGCHSQGSYAMRTMKQDDDYDYDIDDGAYFTKESLVGPRGADKSAADAKEMVRKAVHDDCFKNPPEVLKNCVRIHYNAGYHVDVPVYRKTVRTNVVGEVEVVYELASSNWERSDPLAVTNWFRAENKRQSPDQDNSGQLRRDVRLLKKFACSRDSWKGRIGTGFMITKLITECYISNADREDKALYDTMVAIRDRLDRDLEIMHPVVHGEYLTRGPDDARARFLRDKLSEAIEKLDVLFEAGCTREQALKAWDSVFDETYFQARLEIREERTSTKSANILSAGLLIAGAEHDAVKAAVDKRGGGRYA